LPNFQAVSKGFSGRAKKMKVSPTYKLSDRVNIRCLYRFRETQQSQTFLDLAFAAANFESFEEVA
jgi:hypothetical protein